MDTTEQLNKLYKQKEEKVRKSGTNEAKRHNQRNKKSKKKMCMKAKGKLPLHQFSRVSELSFV